MTSIEEKRKQRAAFMRALYEATDGNQLTYADTEELANSVGVAATDLTALINYLEGEFLLEASWDFSGPSEVRISHAGVVEVEQAIEDPDEGTQHFAALNSINIFGDVTNSQVGLAAGGLSQQGTWTPAHADRVRGWLAEFKAAAGELEQPLRIIADQQIDLAQSEIDKPEPSEAVVRGVLASLRSFAESALASAGAGAGTMALAQVVANWPF